MAIEAHSIEVWMGSWWIAYSVCSKTLLLFVPVLSLLVHMSVCMHVCMYDVVTSTCCLPHSDP